MSGSARCKICSTRRNFAGVGAIGQLPSLSITYTSLTQAVRDPGASVDKVAEIIEQDVGMSAKVLQLVNSAFFGLAQRVTTLQGAVEYLGMETIKNLALASEAFRVFMPHQRIPLSECEAIQRHAHRAAAIAAALPLEPKNRDATVVAALLHDVGSLVLAGTMPDAFCDARTLAAERGCKVFEAEEELLGTSHAEIGAYLLGLWGLPNLAVEAIAHHHRPSRIPHSGFDCTVAVYLADLLDEELEAHPLDTTGAEIGKHDRENLETLGILPRYAEFRKAQSGRAAESRPGFRRARARFRRVRRCGCGWLISRLTKILPSPMRPVRAAPIIA